MNKLKLVVVGPGLIGKTHIQLIQGNPMCKLTALVAPDKPKHYEYANSLSVPVYHSLNECLRSHQVDGVILASPNLFHAEQALQCVKAGVAVLVEKPFTDTVSDGQQVLALAEETGAKVLVGHHRAHSPILAQARKAINEGRLGRLVSVMGSAQFHKPTHYFEAGPWRKEPGGGPILINLIHEIGNMRSLCGEIGAVSAVSSSRIRDFKVEDTVGINLVFHNGVIGTFLLSDTAATAASWEQTSGENPNYAHSAADDCYTVCGTRGSLCVPTLRLVSYADGVDPSWWNPFVEENLEVERLDPLQCQLEHFLDVINGRSVPLVSARDGLRNLQIIEAVRESALSKQLIEV
jgi:predicted dehydrogenase